jgi:hypothetical protein
MIKSAVQNHQVFQICLAATGARLFNTSPQFGIFGHFILSEFISINETEKKNTAKVANLKNGNN